MAIAPGAKTNQCRKHAVPSGATNTAQELLPEQAFEAFHEFAYHGTIAQICVLVGIMDIAKQWKKQQV